MRKIIRITILILSLLFFKEKGKAQNFLNGSFEINTCTSGVDEINLTNGAFNGFMSNVFAFGSYNGGGAGGGDPDIITSSTWGGGGAECGLWYVALTGGGSDALAMGLNAPLISGNSYTISFYDRADGAFPSQPCTIGLSTTNNAFGTLIYTAPSSPVANVWTLRTFTFVAPNNGQYITVESLGTVNTSWVNVDNFSFSNSSNTISPGAIAGGPFCTCSTVSVPFTSTGTYTAGNIYTAQLSDATGSFANPVNIGTLASTANAGTITCTIPCNAVAGTLYQVQIVSSAPTSSVACGSSTASITINALPTITVNSPTICAGQTATLTAAGATTYTWSAGVTNAGADTANAAPINSTSYTVTGTSGGCTGTAIATVTVNPGITIVVNSPTICTGQTAMLTATGAATYTWSAGATPTGGGNATANPAVTATYTVNGTSGGCTNTAIATVTVTSGAGPNVTVNSPTICSGHTATLIANGAATYTWSAGVTNVGADTALAAPLVTTTYTVTGTTAGCSNTAISTVTVHQTPALIATTDTTCAGQTVTLTASGATTYSWSIGSTASSITVTDFVTTFYTVTGNANGCSKTISAAVYVLPSTIVTVTKDTICPGLPATITASGAATYLWSTGSTSSTITVSPLVTSTYTVTGNPTLCASAPVVATVTVINIPATVTVNNASICIGQSAILTATAAVGDTYVWSTGATTDSILVSPNATTTYTVTVTNVCANTATGNSMVAVSPLPVVAFSSVDTTGCAPLCSPFVLSSSVTLGTIASFNWNFGDGQTNDTTLSSTQPHCYTAAGAYSVSLRITSDNGCSDSLTLSNYINVYPIPTAAFTESPTETTLENPTISFTNQSTGATGFTWTFNDSAATSVFSPSHTFVIAGTYPVTLVASNSNGCLDTVTHYVIIEDNFAFYLPNTFSPNGDGINDIFIPKGTGWNIDSYQIWIYDRWGNLCFATNDVTKGWDGTVKGKIAEMDVYVWKVQLNDEQGNGHNYVGTITIIK